MTMPTWLLEHLETTTGAPAGAGRPRARYCPTCRQLILTGLDNHPHCGFQANVDPIPLTADGEAVALITGTTTYELLADGQGRHRLWRRDQHAIRSRPAGQDTRRLARDVYPAHDCTRPPDRWRPLSTRSVFAHTARTQTSVCPF